MKALVIHSESSVCSLHRLQRRAQTAHWEYHGGHKPTGSTSWIVDVLVSGSVDVLVGLVLGSGNVLLAGFEPFTNRGKVAFKNPLRNV